MTACAKISELLSPYLEGELAAQERSSVEEHLEGCSDCRTDLELLRHTVQALHRLPDLPAPAGILKGVREGLEPIPWYRRLARAVAARPRAGLPLGAVATVVVAFGIFMLNDRYPQVSRQAEAPQVPPVAEEKSDRPSSAPALKPAEAPKDLAASTDADLPGPASRPEPTPAPAEAERDQNRRAPAARFDDRVTPTEPAPAPIKISKKKEPVDPPAEGRAAAERKLEEQLFLSNEGSPETFSGSRPAGETESREVGDTGARPVAAPIERLEAAAPATVSPAYPGEDAPPPPTERPRSSRLNGFEAARDGYGAAKDLRVRRKAAPRALDEVSSFTAPEKETFRKSLPPGLDRKGGAGYPSADALGRLEAAQTALAGKAAPRPGETEVLTIVSFDEDEMAQLRQSLKEAGGQLLELKTLDSTASQQMALPYRDQVPSYRQISRGWQIRALVPQSNAEDFVASLKRQSQFQLLHRTAAPDRWEAEPGTQNFEIKLLR